MLHVQLVPINLLRDCLRGWPPSFPEDVAWQRFGVCSPGHLFIQIWNSKRYQHWTLWEKSSQENQQQTNQRKQLPTGQHTPLPCLPSEVVLHKVKPIISTGWRSLRSLSTRTPGMLWLGSLDPALSFSWLQCQSLWVSAQTVSSAAAQAWLDVELGLPGQPGNLPSFTVNASQAHNSLKATSCHLIHTEPRFHIPNGNNTLLWWRCGGRQ